MLVNKPVDTPQSPSPFKVVGYCKLSKKGQAVNLIFPETGEIMSIPRDKIGELLKLDGGSSLTVDIRQYQNVQNT